MLTFGAFVAGFASGWAVRSTVSSTRGLIVGTIATIYSAADRVRRWGATERENVEDLLAEARAKYEAERARAVPRPPASSRPRPIRRERENAA